MLPEFLEWLNRNQWLNVGFLVLGLLSIIISVLLYLRSRKEKIPVYNVRSIALVRDSCHALPEVRILYRDTELKDLTLTRLAFWNRGRDTIDQVDIAPLDPVRLEVPEGARILHAQVDFVAAQANNWNTHVSNDRSALITFDYFERNQGCVLSVYHTAGPSEIVILGTIKSAGPIQRALPEDLLSFRFLDATIGRLPSPIKDYLIRSIVLGPIIFAPLGVFLIPLLVVDWVRRFGRRPPPEYALGQGSWTWVV